MSTLSQFSGGARTPKAIINNTSSGGTYDVVGPSNPLQISVAKKAITGGLTANVLTTVLSLSGSGAVGFLAVTGADATSRTHRCKVTVDGVVIYDATTSACTAAHLGIVVIGSVTATVASGYHAVLDSVPYQSSFLVEYASSLTETGKTNVYYVYRTY